MSKNFLDELNSQNPTGVAFKNVNLKKQIISIFANSGNATIAELCKQLSLSTPKVTSLINELIENELVEDYGKVDSTGGRKPNLYGLAPNAGFFMGIDVKHDSINIGLTDFQKNLVKLEEKIPYELHNDEKSLDQLCQLILEFIDGLAEIPKDKILGIGMNLSGRVNYATGYSYSFFHFHEDPLSEIIEKQIGIPVLLENDSRAMAYGEFCAGVVKEEKDVLYLNLDFGIGMGVMIDSQLYYGKSGYSGEFGHIPIFSNDIICQCGKKGCLETEASGWALVKRFREEIANGSTSILVNNPEDLEKISLGKIIGAVADDDMLAIELVAEIGEKIGRGVAMLINVFNPELVILGGSLAQTEDYIRLPIKSAVKKYSLSLMNNDTQLKISELGNLAGVIGAGLIARNHLLSQI